ncbi:MAG: cytidylate kinase family protein [Bacteroidales bacterium]|jgi:cytidylate kinase|nr:cytidylate kinase family protein [Bacteroidales bacterium]
MISITGDLGSGKSTVSDILCKELKYGYVYTGAIQRKIAEKYGMTTTELNKYAETHPEIDEEIDSTFRSLNDATDLIVDSRLAWFFIPKSFKLFLKTNLMVAADRICKDKQRKNESYLSVDEAAKQMTERKTSENKRYMELYGADCTNMRLFDLIVDTSFISPAKVAEIILKSYKEQSTATERSLQAFVAPQNLYPTKSIKSPWAWDMPNQPIQVVHSNSFDYIIDGHKIVSKALKEGKELVPVIFIDAHALCDKQNTYQEHIAQLIKPELLKEWEEFHSFKYLTYPY